MLENNIVEYHKEYYLKNKEKIRIQQKEWRQKYPEKMREAVIRWKKNNPDRYKTICQRYISYTKPIQKKCICCSGEFETKQYHQVYCSKQCKKKIHSKKHDSRKRKKGFMLLLPNIFPEYVNVDFHHIHPNLPFVMPLPKSLHQEITGDVEKHVFNANEWIDFYFEMDVNMFLNGGC